MRRAPRSPTVTTVLMVLASGGPAVLLAPGNARWFVAGAVLAGWATALLLMRWLRVRGRSRRGYLLPAELPPPPGWLIGRDGEIEQIRLHLGRPRPARRGGARIIVVSGPPGIGKYALAVSAANLLAKHYPDGQLLARLDHFPAGAATHAVLERFVFALQRPDERVPASTEERVARYRRLTANRRILIILDNARDAASLADLLPAGRHSAVIITSRTPLPELGTQLRLGPLDEESALRVLDALVDDDRVYAEREPAEQIIEACAGHPFALQVAGAVLATRRHWTLETAVRRMDEVRLPESAAAALPPHTHVFDLTYALLTEQERGALALIALLDEPRFAPWQVGALMVGAGLSTREQRDATADRTLDRLVIGRLLERRVDDSTGVVGFRFFPDVRSYAEVRLRLHITDAQRRAALTELADVRRELGQRRPEQLLRGQVYRLLDRGELTGALDAARDALALSRERLDAARDAGEERIARSDEALTLAALAEVHVELGWIEDARQRARAALQIGADAARPRALRCLGTVHRRLHQGDQALYQLRRAVSAARRIEDTAEVIRSLRDLALAEAQHDPAAGSAAPRGDHGLASIQSALALCDVPGPWGRKRRPSVLLAFGAVRLARGEYAEAERVLAGADALITDAEIGQQLWRPWIRHRRALVALATGEHEQARELASRAMDGFSQMRHRYGVARCRLAIGRTYLAEHNAEAAAGVLEEALNSFVGCGDRWVEAETATVLAQAHQLGGRIDEAATLLTSAAQTFEDLHDRTSWSRATEALGRLTVLRRQQPASRQRGMWHSGRMTPLPGHGRG